MFLISASRFLIVLLSLVVLANCRNSDFQIAKNLSQTTVLTMSQKINIKVGELGSQFKKRYPDFVHIEHQPAGVDFYNIHWNKLPRGTIKIDHGKHAFNIDHVLSVFAGQDLGPLAQEGLSEFNINTGISAPDLISHDERD